MTGLRSFNISLASAAVLVAASTFTPAAANDALAPTQTAATEAAAATETAATETAANEAFAADLRLPKRKPVTRQTQFVPPVLPPATVVRRAEPRIAPTPVARPVPRVVVTMLMLGVGF